MTTENQADFFTRLTPTSEERLSLSSPLKIKSSPNIDRSDGPPVDLLEEAIRNNQRIEQYYTGANHVEVKIPHNRPIQVLFIGDLHIGSGATVTEKVSEITQTVLEQSDTYVVFMGDIIEGLKPSYYRTNIRTSLPVVSSHIKLARRLVLEPLAKANRVLALTCDHFGHEYWNETMNLWVAEARGLGIPLITQGGTLEIIFANGHSKKIQPFHLTERKGRVDILHGTTAVAQKYSKGNRPDAVAGAHLHRAGIGMEVRPDNDKCAVIQIGTLKGIDPNYPDPLGRAAGMRRPSPLGQGLILRTRTRAEPKNRGVIFPTFRHGRIARQAIGLLNRAERQGITEEVIGESREKLGQGPEVRYDPRRSRLVKDAFPEPRKSEEIERVVKNGRGYADQFAKIYYNIATELPVTVLPIAGARIGSYTENREALQKLIKIITDNPYYLTVFGRSIIDGELCKDPHRLEVLNRAIKTLSPALDSALALMLDSTLRNAAWKRKPAIAPATYLSHGLNNLKLITHMSRIVLAVGKGKKKPWVNMVVLDHLEGRGRSGKATAGLRSVYDNILPDKPGVLIGGHMPLAGTAAIYDLHNPETPWPWFVAPGWTAYKVDSLNKANTRRGGAAGLGIIILPGQAKEGYLVFATADLDETQYMSQALTLWVAAQKLGHQIS